MVAVAQCFDFVLRRVSLAQHDPELVEWVAQHFALSKANKVGRVEGLETPNVTRLRKHNIFLFNDFPRNR